MIYERTDHTAEVDVPSGGPVRLLSEGRRQDSYNLSSADLALEAIPMPSEFVDTLQQVIYPGDCDVIGHLNTRHYTALFDHAMWELMRQQGGDDAYGSGATMGWVDIETLVRYRREVNVGSAVRIKSRIVRVGNTSLVTEHVLEAGGEERASCRTTSVRFSLVERKPVQVPDCLHRYRDSVTAGDT
jgi:acyl-CoA thioester hydrolase